MNTTALSWAEPRVEPKKRAPQPAIGEPPWARRLLIAVALSFIAIFLLAPLAIVFAEALKKGWQVYLAAITDPDALSAIRMTLLAASFVMLLALNLLQAWSASRR